jgi:DNA-binding SARP family transcriptional activator
MAEVHATGFKTVAPSLDGTIARTAALAALRRAAGPARWLTGASGTGKSTLVASHVRDAAPSAWYRLDARDDDPAFFYANFGAALERAWPQGPDLPTFVDDDRAAEDAFAERYFTAVVARCGSGTFVLDNAHVLAREPMQRALARFVAAIDGRIELWLVGEEPPGPAFFDVVAQRRLTLCNDVPLAFDANECAALASASRLRGISGADLAALTGGHAGALVLACEFLRGAESLEPGQAARAVEQIHRHLLGKLLARMPEPRRELLLRTCFAPQFDEAIVRALAGDPAVAEIEALRAQGLLRRTGVDGRPIYEAHGLVRRGLQSLLTERLGTQGAGASAERTADALAANGFDEDAFALLAERGADERAGPPQALAPSRGGGGGPRSGQLRGRLLTERAADLLERIAERYARRGQAELLMRANARLPAGVAETRPWLCFWAGQALLGFNEEAARGWFELAYAAFERTDNRLGMRLAAARVVMAFGLDYADLRTLDAWLARHERAGGHEPVEPGAPYESALCLGTMAASLTLGAHPQGVDADALVRRLRMLLDDDDAWLTPDEPVIAARLVVDHARIFSTPERAQALALETSAYAKRTSASALQRGRWYIAASWAFYVDGKHDRARECLDEARRLTELCGSRRLVFELGMVTADAALKHDLAKAAAELAVLEKLMAEAAPAQRADFARIKARALLLQDQPAEGLRWAEHALTTAEIAGYSGAHAREFQVEHIYALAANERFDDALAAAERMLGELEEQQRDAVLIIRDALRFFAGGERDHALLADVLKRAEALPFINLLSRARVPMARLCRRALSDGVATDFVRRMVSAQRLVPPRNTGPEWPWPVAIRTLGGFELTIGGERYQPAHKTQDKPLELLKLLVTCLTLGRDSADREWIAERLWPDADAPNARKSLETTLSRLRKLLRDDDAVVLSEGRLRLAPTRVWTDIAPLLRALQHAGAHRENRAHGKPLAVSNAVADIAAVLDHYHGRFLPEEGDAPWLLAGREAVAAAVRSALLIADAVLEGREDDRLIAALERALAADPTSEDLARALMRACSRLGQHAEAIRVYRRLREMLSIILGLPPSRETEELKDDLYARVPAGDALARAESVARGRASPPNRR